MTEVTKDNPFDLHRVDGRILWMPMPATMETMMEVFNEDRVVHPLNSHICVVPRFMTHLWRKHLGKDADVLMTIVTGDHIWYRSQHEPLILTIVLPFAYVENYRGPWIARGLETPESLKKELEPGFKIACGQDPNRIPDMDRTLCYLWKDLGGRSRTLLL